MKTPVIISQLKKITPVVVGSLLLTACGGAYVNSSYYDNDGIYGSEAPVVRSTPTPTRSANASVYKKQFSDKAREYKVADDGKVVNVEEEYLDPNQGINYNYNSNYGGWGSNPNAVTVINYNNGWGMNNWGWWGWNHYAPAWGWNMGWNSCGFYNGWYGGGFCSTPYMSGWGGYYGGGGGYSVSGGGGGSSYVALLTSGSTAAGLLTQPGANMANLGPTTSSSPSCASGAGYGGLTTDETAAQAGHGCVVIQYGSTYVSYNYFGTDFSWVVPADVTSVIFHVLGAGGGGGRTSTLYGGGGGYATGTYAVTPGQTYSVIVGQGGSRPTGTRLSGCYYTPLTYGGGGRGGSCYQGGWSSAWQGSGGGRSAIRAAGSSTDLVTAGGGGGGGYGGAGGAGGGTTGTSAGGGGGTQVAGGAGGSSANGLAGVAGSQYLGGNSRDEGGGGGGGYWGGGGGGDNTGGGGGSSYIALLTSGSTTAGTSRDPGLKTPVNSTAPTVGGGAAIGGTLTATAGTWAASGSQTWKWQFSTDGVTFSDISGATSSTYSPTQAGYFRVIETHSNLLGSASGTSTATQVAAPVVTDCTPTSGTFTHCKRFNFYAANQTYTMPSDMPAGSTFQIELWGAGGGGGVPRPH